jgi:hypothetical protein
MTTWIQYDGWLESSASRKLAAELRATGKYAKVRIGNYVRDEGVLYSKVYVQVKRFR